MIKILHCAIWFLIDFIIRIQDQEMSEDKVLKIYADGVFDGFHIGHANMFKQCRELFPGRKLILLAGVCDQKDIEKYKGPTISTEQERIEMVRQCKWVDEVYERSPWLVTESKYVYKFRVHS
jgi:cytidyltransferase-like protein